MHVTQQQIADRLNQMQPSVSMFESADIGKAQISTLRKYARAMNGTLRVSIEVDGVLDPVDVSDASDTASTPDVTPR